MGFTHRCGIDQSLFEMQIYADGDTVTPRQMHPHNCDTCGVEHHQIKHVRYAHDYPAFVCAGERLVADTPMVIRWRGCASWRPIE